MRGRVIFEGTTYHPTLGRIEEGQIVDLPEGFDFGASEIFAPAEGSGKVDGPARAAEPLFEALMGSHMDDVRRLRDELAGIDPSFAAARDTKKAELVRELLSVLGSSAEEEDVRALLRDKGLPA